jgi:hypothetical protein
MKHLLRVGLALSTLHAAEPPALPTAHQTRDIEGWTVHVDERLLAGAPAELGCGALALLGAKLADVATLLPADKVARLRQVVFWLDLDHGALTSMQYHPSADWLEQHGYRRELAKAVHIPVAARFTDRRHQQVQPWCVLHELAHAYHDQVLGFDHAEVRAVWERYAASGHGNRALHVDGRKVRHYALTNAKEFFAEMTEAYFGTNDFYPFVHGELKLAEPETHALLRRIWGPSALEKAAGQ